MSQRYPQHQYLNTPYQPYPMNDINQQSPNHVRPATNEGYDKESYPPTREKRYMQIDNSRRACWDQICCGCCSCCPRWCRWISCILFLLVVAMASILGLLVSQFTMPKVDFTGIQGTPSFGMNDTTVNLGVNLGFSVNNPNVESITFSTLEAEAFYHGYNETSIGGGSISNVHISSNAVTNIQFPFTLKVNLASQQDQEIVSRLLSDCGIGDGEQQKIKLDYKVIATVNIIGINIHIPFSNIIDFDCPMNSASQQDVLGTISKTVLGLVGGNNTNTTLPAGLSGLTSNLTSLPSQVADLAPNLTALPTEIAGLLKNGA